MVKAGRQIALRRDDLGWNQDQLADRARVSRSSVWKLENDQRVREETRDAILEALSAEEKARGVRPTLSTPPDTTDPSMKEGADAATTLREIDARLERIQLFLAETLEDVRRARAVIVDERVGVSRKRG